MRREPQEELGLERTFASVLAVDWVSSTASGLNPAMGLPGEIITVSDGGTLTEEVLHTVRLPGREVVGLRHVEPAHLGDHMAAGDARRLVGARPHQRHRPRRDGRRPSARPDPARRAAKNRRP